MNTRLWLRIGFALLWVVGIGMAFSALAADVSRPVRIGITAEFGVLGSQAAQSIEKGILLAIDEINAGGGVLGGRKLVLERQDDRGVPARGVDNFEAFAANPEVVAVFCGRFSPVAIEIVPLANRLGLLFLDPWAAADGITSVSGNAMNYAFRLSMTDTWAMETMAEHAQGRGLNKVAVFVPNTAWGRSSESALAAYAKRHPAFVQDVFWYNWGETSFGERISQARARGAQAILMVANENEGAPIVRQIAALPKAERLPIIAHWGILGSDFAAAVGDTLHQVDLAVVHTFSFSDAKSARSELVAGRFKRLFGSDVAALRAQVGFAHAYDLTHLLARAISRAGSAERSAVRAAMERLDPYDGLVRRYARPFTPERHEALDRRQVRMGRFDRDGNLTTDRRK